VKQRIPRGAGEHEAPADIGIAALRSNAVTKWRKVGV